MKKYFAIVATFIVIGCASTVFAQRVTPLAPYEQEIIRQGVPSGSIRVKLLVQGFEDNKQAELLIAQFLLKENSQIQFVDYDPDYVCKITADQIRKSSVAWVNDRNANMRNNTLRQIDYSLSNWIYSSYSRSRLANLGKQAAYNVGRTQLARYAKPENFEYQNLSSTVTIELINRRSSQVVAKSIGVNAITTKTLKSYQDQPYTVVSNGDLSSVGVPAGANLYGTSYVILQLSAFVKATLPENQIIRQ